MSTVTIRAGRHHDVDEVLALWSTADVKPTTTDDAGSIRRLIEHDPAALLVALHDGGIVGSLIATWDGWRAAMWRLAVHPDHRRQGIARALVQQAEQRLHQLGARRIALFVATTDPAPAEFWTACGYRPQSRRQRLVKNLQTGPDLPGGIAQE